MVIQPGLKHLPVVDCNGSFMILVWWALFALFAGYPKCVRLDGAQYQAGNLVIECSVCLCHRWVLQTSYPHAFGMNLAECSRVPGPQVQTEHQMTKLLVLSTWETMALHNRLETYKTWWTGTSMVGSRPVLRGLVPSSCAEVAGVWFAISRLVMRSFGLVNGGLCATLFLVGMQPWWRTWKTH
jgi:hypothetical protein